MYHFRRGTFRIIVAVAVVAVFGVLLHWISLLHAPLDEALQKQNLQSIKRMRSRVGLQLQHPKFPLLEETQKEEDSMEPSLIVHTHRPRLYTTTTERKPPKRRNSARKHLIRERNGTTPPKSAMTETKQDVSKNQMLLKRNTSSIPRLRRVPRQINHRTNVDISIPVMSRKKKLIRRRRSIEVKAKGNILEWKMNMNVSRGNSSISSRISENDTAESGPGLANNDYLRASVYVEGKGKDSKFYKVWQTVGQFVSALFEVKSEELNVKRAEFVPSLAKGDQTSNLSNFRSDSSALSLDSQIQESVTWSFLNLSHEDNGLADDSKLNNSDIQDSRQRSGKFIGILNWFGSGRSSTTEQPVIQNATRNNILVSHSNSSELSSEFSESLLGDISNLNETSCINCSDDALGRQSEIGGQVNAAVNFTDIVTTTSSTTEAKIPSPVLFEFGCSEDGCETWSSPKREENESAVESEEWNDHNCENNLTSMHQVQGEVRANEHSDFENLTVSDIEKRLQNDWLMIYCYDKFLTHKENNGLASDFLELKNGLVSRNTGIDTELPAFPVIDADDVETNSSIPVIHLLTSLIKMENNSLPKELDDRHPDDFHNSSSTPIMSELGKNASVRGARFLPSLGSLFRVFGSGSSARNIGEVTEEDIIFDDLNENAVGSEDATEEVAEPDCQAFFREVLENSQITKPNLFDFLTNGKATSAGGNAQLEMDINLHSSARVSDDQPTDIVTLMNDSTPAVTTDNGLILATDLKISEHLQTDNPRSEKTHNSRISTSQQPQFMRASFGRRYLEITTEFYNLSTSIKPNAAEDPFEIGSGEIRGFPHYTIEEERTDAYFEGVISTTEQNVDRFVELGSGEELAFQDFQRSGDGELKSDFELFDEGSAGFLDSKPSTEKDNLTDYSTETVQQYLTWSESSPNYIDSIGYMQTPSENPWLRTKTPSPTFIGSTSSSYYEDPGSLNLYDIGKVKSAKEFGKISTERVKYSSEDVSTFGDIFASNSERFNDDHEQSVTSKEFLKENFSLENGDNEYLKVDELVTSSYKVNEVRESGYESPHIPQPEVDSFDEGSAEGFSDLDLLTNVNTSESPRFFLGPQFGTGEIVFVTEEERISTVRSEHSDSQVNNQNAIQTEKMPDAELLRDMKSFDFTRSKEYWDTTTLPTEVYLKNTTSAILTTPKSLEVENYKTNPSGNLSSFTSVDYSIFSDFSEGNAMKPEASRGSRKDDYLQLRCNDTSCEMVKQEIVSGIESLKRESNASFSTVMPKQSELVCSDGCNYTESGSQAESKTQSMQNKSSTNYKSSPDRSATTGDFSKYCIGCESPELLSSVLPDDDQECDDCIEWGTSQESEPVISECENCQGADWLTPTAGGLECDDCIEWGASLNELVNEKKLEIPETSECDDCLEWQSPPSEDHVNGRKGDKNASSECDDCDAWQSSLDDSKQLVQECTNDCFEEATDDCNDCHDWIASEERPTTNECNGNCSRDHASAVTENIIAQTVQPKYCSHDKHCDASLDEECVDYGLYAMCGCERSFVRHPTTRICTPKLVLEATLRLPKESYVEDLKDPKSTAYKYNKDSAEKMMWTLVKSSGNLASSVTALEAVDFRPGSLIILWKIVIAASGNTSVFEETRHIGAELRERLLQEDILRTLPFKTENAVLLSISQAINPCERPELNYCSRYADCIRDDHRPGGFLCKCRKGFPDISKHREKHPGESCRPFCPLDYCGEHGVCQVDPEGNIGCMCIGWFFGEHCEISGVVVVASAAIGNAAIVFMAIICICWLKKRRHRSRRGYESSEFRRTQEFGLNSYDNCFAEITGVVAVEQCNEPSKISAVPNTSAIAPPPPGINLTSNIHAIPPLFTGQQRCNEPSKLLACPNMPPLPDTSEKPNIHVIPPSFSDYAYSDSSFDMSFNTPSEGPAIKP